MARSAASLQNSRLATLPAIAMQCRPSFSTAALVSLVSRSGYCDICAFARKRKAQPRGLSLRRCRDQGGLFAQLFRNLFGTFFGTFIVSSLIHQLPGRIGLVSGFGLMPLAGSAPHRTRAAWLPARGIAICYSVRPAPALGSRVVSSQTLADIAQVPAIGFQNHHRQPSEQIVPFERPVRKIKRPSNVNWQFAIFCYGCQKILERFFNF